MSTDPFKYILHLMNLIFISPEHNVINYTFLSLLGYSNYT